MKSIEKFKPVNLSAVFGGERKTSRTGSGSACEGDIKYKKDEWNKTKSEANDMNVWGGRDYDVCGAPTGNGGSEGSTPQGVLGV